MNGRQTQAQKDVLLQFQRGGRRKLIKLAADEFQARGGALVLSASPATDPVRVDGRTMASLERAGFITEGKQTSPWTWNMNLTPAGRRAVREVAAEAAGQ